MNRARLSAEGSRGRRGHAQHPTFGPSPSLPFPSPAGDGGGLTGGHRADEDGAELQDGAEGLLGVRGAQPRAAVALQHQPLVLALQKHQQALQQQHLQIWGGGTALSAHLPPAKGGPSPFLPDPSPQETLPFSSYRPTVLSLLMRQARGPSWIIRRPRRSRFWAGQAGSGQPGPCRDPPPPPPPPPRRR